MKIKWGIKFLLQKRKEYGEFAFVFMRMTLHGEKPLDVSLWQKVKRTDWDTENQYVLPSSPDALDINQTIMEWKGIANEIIARFELIEKRVPTVDEFKELFFQRIGRKIKKKTNTPDSEDFFKVYDYFMQTMGALNDWSDRTRQIFSSVKNHLHKFDPKISFKTLDENKMHDYLAYLNRQGFLNSTISKNISFFKWFLRWATSKGYYSGEAHITFKPKFKGTDGNSKEIVYLTQGEIKILQTHTFARESLERVRDMFLFCCFTGLRYSDAAKLKKTDIKGDFISVVTQKTSDALNIELNKHSRAIIDKYKDEPLPQGLALPVVSNQKMNDMLKEIGKECGIDEPIRLVHFQGNKRIEEVLPKYALLSTHCGRRTFVVTALQLGIPAEVIMKWTGHKDFAAMKPYVKIVDELKKQQMSRFDLL